MTQQEKQQIADALRTYCGRYPSQNKAANSLKNVSPATVSNMLSSKWELIKDEMWRNVASQIGHSNLNWNVVKTTSVFEELYQLLADAQSDSGVHAIVGEAGCGKSQTADCYVKENPNAYHLACSEFWNRKTFMQELLASMGRDANGFTVNEMMREVVKSLTAMENPLLILDEADKLSDQVLYFFITLYNQLEDCCGIILMATPYLKKRIQRGVDNNKKGYNEIFSRLGRRFIVLDGNTYEDLAAVCEANGLADANQIEKIVDDCNSDLRRVKKLTKAQIKKRTKAA